MIANVSIGSQRMRIRFQVTALDYNCHSNERAHGETVTHFSEVTDLGYNTAG